MSEVKNDTVLDVEEAFSKTELYFEENKKSILIIVGAVLALVGFYLAYKYWYIPGEDETAKKEMFVYEKYFEQDSTLNKAIDGFTKITDDYGITPTGNLAECYLGLSYLRKGDFEKAIEHLEEYESDDKMIGPVALGALGDAHLELGQADEAISYYLKAADKGNNALVSPIYLKKAGFALEDQKKYEDAVKVYERIKKDYSNSDEGREMEKFIARAKTIGNLN